MSLSFAHSPIKASRQLWDSRTASDARKDAEDLQLVSEISGEDFISTFLSEHVAESPPEWADDQLAFVQQIKDTAEIETQLYQESAPLLRLLNSISKRVLESHSEPNTLALIFRSYDKQVIKSSYPGPDQKPDVVAVWGDPEALSRVASEFVLTMFYEKLLTSQPASNDLDALPEVPCWFEVVTVGETKLNTHNSYQIGDYARALLRHHPELNAVLGFATRRNSYRLVYHDSGVIHQSSPFLWSSPGPLYAFVRALYGRPFHDCSMAILNGKNGTASWATKIGDDIYVTQQGHPDIGPGQRRFTNLVTHLVTAMIFFIKDIWRDVRRRYFEGNLYEKAHHEQPLAGLMTVQAYGYVLDKDGERISTTQLGLGPGRVPANPRYKMRLLTSDVGRPLQDIHTLRQFLCVMYDACVVQRNLYRKCRILHRDISDGNIMLAPDNQQYRHRCAIGYAEVKFANQVLSGNQNEKPDPACLIIDLGNCADLNDTQHVEVLAERTGTPKFIARSISCGRHLDFFKHKTLGAQMPKLTGQALDLYRCAAGDQYERYNNAVDYDASPSAEAEIDFKHRLFHDAESTFCVITWILVRSCKRGSPAEIFWTTELRNFMQAMREHCPGDMALDSRSNLDSSAADWKRVLHEDLADLAPMLSRMHRYVHPEWASRSDLDSEHPEHMHEALMRLLLIEIVRIKENNTDIPLDVAGRSLPPALKSSSRSSRSSRTTSRSLGLPKTRSHTRNSREDSASVQKNSILPRESPGGRKRSGSPLGDLPRRSPRHMLLEMQRDEQVIDWGRAEAKKVTWGKAGELGPTSQDNCSDNQQNGAGIALSGI
ncbi:other FunK1 protein kinase [Rhizoctonia solani]|uniref:Other FunK1 protein kinase n=1 Tax=Rhizoctonia solani TaxID=456999 RepID=A0A8H7HB03_9AGAM|nr:other FunK1 protein kinase [Rhizoctonia solani]